MNVEQKHSPELLALSAEFREALRHSVFFARRFDSDGELSVAQLSMLNMVASGPVRVGEIARNLGVKVPSATEQIIRLEKAGLVLRQPDPEDSRAVRVALTEAGKQTAASSNERRNHSMAGVLAALTAQDREALSKALPVISKINNNIHQD
ncbi:MarR family winged helix-turn-helix transcriptional regulator [Pseudarthrobacter sp. J1738]|uniref:MarR family winged helix-turn-helix transcriptional regulator n=1 Tax=unclassified Pseudarthrobacter TaxID=2647000 RepID=UPI003D274D01